MDFFYYLVICKCLSTTIRVYGTVQFTFFLVMKLNITIVTSCDLLIVTLVTSFFSSLKLENGLKKHVRNVAIITYGFAELVGILFTFNTRCDYVIQSFLFMTIWFLF